MFIPYVCLGAQQEITPKGSICFQQARHEMIPITFVFFLSINVPTYKPTILQKPILTRRKTYFEKVM